MNPFFPDGGALIAIDRSIHRGGDFRVSPGTFCRSAHHCFLLVGHTNQKRNSGPSQPASSTVCSKSNDFANYLLLQRQESNIVTTTIITTTTKSK
jgi:hypothetical protein